MNLLDSNDFKEIIEISKNNSNVIALILFGSYSKGKAKKNSDLDIAIIRKKGSQPHNFLEINYRDNNFDIVFFDLVSDNIKFSILSQGKILVINDKGAFLKMRRNFLHIYRDNYPFFERNMKRMLANV